MFELSILRKTPPKVFLWSLYLIAPIQLIFRFLTGTIYGALLFSVALYWLMDFACESKPFTFYQMLLWIDQLEDESKTAIATSVITILGFLVAFHTATQNWKSQALTNLKINAANEIEHFYNELLRLVASLEIEAKYVVETLDLIKKDGITQRTAAKVESAIDRTKTFEQSRQRLSEMAVDVHRLLGRDYSLLGTVWGAIDALDECAKAVTEVAEKMWIHVPFIESGRLDTVTQFVSKTNVDEWKSLVECCDRNHGFISATVGGVRGSLLGPLIGANFSSLADIRKKHSEFVEALAHTQKRTANH